MIHPSGVCSLRFRFTRILPSAVTLIVMSSMSGSPPVGSEMAIGFGEIRRSIPPQGAVSRPAP